MRRQTLVVLALLATGCGAHGSNDVAQDPASITVSMPTALPASPVRVTSAHLATVLDEGEGPKLCLGGVLQSLPPQCDGPALAGWEWAEHPEHETSGQVTWGEFSVMGTWDGTRLAYESAIPAALYDVAAAPTPDFSSPCPEPSGGWQVLDPDKTTEESRDRTTAAAQKLPGFSTVWVDHSPNPLFGRQPAGIEEELAMNDPTKLILNVRVTEDLAGAEAKLRETWGGMLCVSKAEHTESELALSPAHGASN